MVVSEAIGMPNRQCPYLGHAPLEAVRVSREIARPLLRAALAFVPWSTKLTPRAGMLGHSCVGCAHGADTDAKNRHGDDIAARRKDSL